MKKEEIYVSVESKEQAEMFRKVLGSMGYKMYAEIFDMSSNKYLRTNYSKKFGFHSTKLGLTSVTFPQLIEILMRKPLLVSEDGVPIYEGDEYFAVDLGFNSICHKGKLSKHFDYTKAGFKYFSSESKALEWIEAQKPKSITIELFTLEVNAICTDDKVVIKDVYGDFSISISKEKLVEINKAMEELKNG